MKKKIESVRVGRRYRPDRLASHYDVVVVGSGIGGLTTAACLAKMGKKVCVLEQHYTAGGFTHSYERQGYEWDVGVHYIGDMGSTKTTGRRLFDYITDGELHWAPMDDHFDRIYLGDQHYDLVAGKEAYRQALIDAFPQEQDAIDAYLSAMRAIHASLKSYTMDKVLPDWAKTVAGVLTDQTRPAFFYQTTREVLEGFTRNQKLIAVLTGQWGDNGLPPSQSSFIIHSMIAMHYMRGGYYPVGGASQIARTILPVIRNAGGEVFTYADVTKIELNTRGRVKGVSMADGAFLACEKVVSNAGVFNTFDKLLASHKRLPDYRARLKTVERSMASVCLYIGLQATAEELSLPKTNLWIYPSEHYETHLDEFNASPDAPLPLVYISFPSAKDPTFSDRYPGRATIEIVAPEPPQLCQPWADTNWGKRGSDYEALKEQFAQRLLAHLYAKLPHLQGKVDYYELSTSLSTDHFCRYSQGEIYGLNHTPGRFEQSWLKPKTEVQGLYLTGQDVMTCGVVGAMMGGFLTAVELGGMQGIGLAKRILGPPPK